MLNNMMFYKKFASNLFIMGATGLCTFGILNMPQPYAYWALIVILVTMALGVVYFMTLSQIESAERLERWAKQDAESAARIAKLRSDQKAKRPSLS